MTTVVLWNKKVEERVLIKRFLYFFIWTIVIGVIFYWGMKWGLKIEETAATEFKLYPVVLFSAIFPIVLGILLRLPQLIIEIKENKKRTFDWPKFIAVGFPALLLLLMDTLAYFGTVLALNIMSIGSTILPTMLGIVFGYILFEETISSKILVI